MTGDGTPLKIGKVSRGWLAEIGVTTLEQLQALGAIETYRRLKARHPDRVTLNMLWGLEGLLSGRRWDQIPPEEKAELRREVGE